MEDKVVENVDSTDELTERINSLEAKIKESLSKQDAEKIVDKKMINMQTNLTKFEDENHFETFKKLMDEKFINGK